MISADSLAFSFLRHNVARGAHMMLLQDILTPLSIADFCQMYLGRQLLHLSHGPSRFSDLVDQRLISKALAQLRVSGRRVRMAKNGETIPAERYLFHSGHPSGSKLNPGGMTREARAGATLVVDSVDELVPGFWALAEDCERHLDVPVHMNLYVSWRESQGFDLHWDEHDVIVLQVEGSKRWTVYEPTVLHPVKEPNVSLPPPPTSRPIFDEDLAQGGVLYLPRGWWHVARAVEYPSIHVTMGLNGQTGVDLLRWAATRLYEHDFGRMDLPLHAAPAAQRAWLDALQRELSTVLREPTLLTRCSSAYRRKVQLRYDVDLTNVREEPCAEHPAGDAVKAAIQVLAPMLVVQADAADGGAGITCRGVKLRCTGSLTGAMLRLATGDLLRLADLSSGLTLEQSTELRQLIGALVTCGLARVESA